jgi:hypothetical protein
MARRRWNQIRRVADPVAWFSARLAREIVAWWRRPPVCDEPLVDRRRAAGGCGNDGLLGGRRRAIRWDRDLNCTSFCG